jgi:hypothetical protein
MWPKYSPLATRRVGEICVHHCPQLRVGGADLKGGHQTGKNLRRSFRDLSINVGHNEYLELPSNARV